MLKKAILIVCFGVRNEKSRHKTLEIYQKRVALQFPQKDVFMAFTSNRIVSKIKRREDLDVLTPKSALNQLQEMGYEEVIVQAYSMIYGEGFKQVNQFLMTNPAAFKSVKIVPPLLHEAVDYKKIANLVVGDATLKSNQALVLVGHGTNGLEYSSYLKLNENLQENVILGTLKGELDLPSVISRLSEMKVQEVYLRPLLLTSGYHVGKDIQLEWVTGLQEAGFDVWTSTKPLGEHEEIIQYFIDLIKE